MNKNHAALALAILAGTFTMGGCANVQPTAALPADAFVANQPVIGPGAGQGNDHSGAVNFEERKRPPHEASEATRISPTVANATKGPPDIATQPTNESDFPAPKTDLTGGPPSTQGTPGISLGEYQTVGSVVAVVNGEPIFADRVIAKIEHALKAKALSTPDEKLFQNAAMELVDQQIAEFIRDSVAFAAAQKALEKKDEQIAVYATSEWRKDQIRRAGGSEALARQKAAEEGQDFEELVREEYRRIVLQVYSQNKIFPRIDVTPQDIRQYYNNNISQFQKIAAAKYRVIWIDADKTGGREPALDKAGKILYRAHHGEDFSDLAGTFNDDPALLQNHGKVGDQNGWMGKKAFVAEVVDDAVWKLHPTEVSDPIPASYRGHDGYWIAKLEEIRPGETERFESERVQNAINETLRSQQYKKLYDALVEKLRRDRLIDDDPNARQILMQMVMQKYHVWTGK